MIGHSHISNAITPQYRAFFAIACDNTIPETEPYLESVRAFGEAVEIISRTCRLDKAVNIFFGSRKISVQIGDILITSELCNQALHVSFHPSNIHFDIHNAILQKYEAQVASYLEELVHIFMRTTNEFYTHRIVEMLYPKAFWDGTEFKSKMPN